MGYFRELRATWGCERRARPDVMGAGARSQGGGDTPALGRYCTSRPSSAHLPSAPIRTTFSRTCRIFYSNRLSPGHHEGYPGPYRLSTALAAIRA